MRADRETGDDVSHEIGQEDREALWTGEATGVESNGVDDQIPAETSTAPTSELDSDRSPAQDTAAQTMTPPLTATVVPSRAEQQPIDVSDHIGQEPQEAPWSGEATGVESNGVDDQIPAETSTAPTSELDSDRGPAEDTGTTTNVDPLPFGKHAEPGAKRGGSRSIVGAWISRESTSRRLALLCLVGVIGLVAVLTGRAVRRYV
jgi:hypothetical protein